MESKVVILTGASSGIGKGIALHLASIGYKKLVLVARRAELLEETAKQCRYTNNKNLEPDAVSAVNCSPQELGCL